MTFYDMNGKELSKDSFIDYFSLCYFEKNADVKGIRCNNEIVENAIENILINGFQTRKDVIAVLAWKTGKLSHTSKMISEKAPFHYHKNWFNEDDFSVMFYGKTAVCLTEFADKVLNLQGSSDDQSSQTILQNLCSSAPDGIGTVYLITFLFFLSHGEYPIYDRFADIALQAILGNKQPSGNIPYSALPTKKDKDFDSICSESGRYGKYIRDIETVFGEDYKNYRKIDQALWVYGHQFNSKKRQSC